MSEELISGSLQENILILLCFNDHSAPLLINSIDPGLFESDVYKDIAKQAIDYYNQFKVVPKEHIADLLEEKLDTTKNPKKAALYEKILISLYNSKDQVNEKYIVTQVQKFIRQQRLKASIVDAAKYVRDGDLDAAELTLEKSLKTTIDVFQPGVLFRDPNQSLRFFDETVQAYRTGIEPLDRIGFGPAPGELYIVLAAPNRGKSWHLIHIGKMAVIQRLRVLHISLEMSEEKMSQRYIQSFFSLGKRQGQTQIINFRRDELGRLMGLELDTSLVRPTLADPNIEKAVRRKLENIRGDFYIKRFPTNALTIRGLEVYLDSMERYYNFTPDILLVDYADLFKLDSQNLRISTGEIYKELRRIAVERNIAVVTASQSNRLGEDARVLSLKYLGEDYSKAATADNILAYCQTSAELRFGLARLFIAKARDEEREQTILISQAYRIGQFCMNAVQMHDRYWDELNILHTGPAEPMQDESGGDNPPRRRRSLPRQRYS